jgi:hypothetical protein
MTAPDFSDYKPPGVDPCRWGHNTFFACPPESCMCKKENRGELPHQQKDQFAPSEEMQIFCDVPKCDAVLSMVAGVPRSEHGWGRATIYDGISDSRNYDLCTDHFLKVLDAIGQGGF